MAGGRAAKGPRAHRAGFMASGDKAAGFGHAPDLDHRHAESLLECRMKRGVDAGAQPVAQPMVAIAGRGRRLHQRGRDDAQIVERRGPRRADVIPPAVAMKAVGDDQADPLEQRHAQRVDPRVHMEIGQRQENPLYPVAHGQRAAMGGIHLAHGKGIVIVDQRALGPRRGARGIDQRDFRMPVGRARHRGARRGGHRGRAGQGLHRVHQNRRRGASAGQPVGMAGQRHHRIGFAMLDQIAQLVVKVIGVDRDLHHPQPGKGQEMHDMRRVVVQRQRHAVPDAPALRRPLIRHRIGRGPHLGKGQLCPLGQVIAPGARGHGQKGMVGVAVRRRHQGIIQGLHHTRSTSRAMPWPAPRHIDRIARRPPVSSRCCKAVRHMRTPVTPGGCPMLMPPP